MAGALAPLAIFWVILTFRLQQRELNLNTRALEVQAEETRNLATSAAGQLEVAREQLHQEQSSRQPLFVWTSFLIPQGKPEVRVENRGGVARRVEVAGAAPFTAVNWLDRGSAVVIHWDHYVRAHEARADLNYSDVSGARWSVAVRIPPNADEPVLDDPKRVNN